MKALVTQQTNNYSSYCSRTSVVVIKTCRSCASLLTRGRERSVWGGGGYNLHEGLQPLVSRLNRANLQNKPTIQLIFLAFLFV